MASWDKKGVYYMYYKESFCENDVLLEFNIFKKLADKIGEMRAKREAKKSAKFDRKSEGYTPVTIDEFNNVVTAEKELAEKFAAACKQYNATYRASNYGLFKAKLFDPDTRKAIDKLSTTFIVFFKMDLKTISRLKPQITTNVSPDGSVNTGVSYQKNYDTELAYKRRKLWREEMLPELRRICESIGLEFNTSYEYGTVEFIAKDNSVYNLSLICTDIDEFEDGYSDEIYIGVVPETHYILKKESEEMGNR